MSYDLMRTTQVDNLLSLESLKNELMEGEQVYCIATKKLYIKDGTDVVPIGLILTSPNNTSFIIKVSDTGILSAEEVI